ncbi:MAG: MTH938/NDUFAF3 family protein, partial [Candidatus Zixiibacteriota bacterium]
KPDVVIVGTGNPGLMKVLPETGKLIKSKGARLIVQQTKEACKTYNQLSSSQRVIALLHLTC